jgi:hypothetical protein
MGILWGMTLQQHVMGLVPLGFTSNPLGKRGYHGVPYLKRQTQGAVGVVDSSSGELVTQKADGFV